MTKNKDKKVSVEFLPPLLSTDRFVLPRDDTARRIKSATPRRNRCVAYQ